jgi:hypothetical protein
MNEPSLTPASGCASVAFADAARRLVDKFPPARVDCAKVGLKPSLR